MAVDRLLPTSASGVTTGDAYMNAVSEEVLALWDRSHNKLSAVGGTANAVTATCTPAITSTLVDGMLFTIIPIVDNTLAVTLAIGAVPAVAVVDRDGTALTGGMFKTGRMLFLEYNGTSGKLHILQPVEVGLQPASQAQQEAAVSSAVAVTPANQQFHPSAAKVWMKGVGTTIAASYGVTSISSGGTGIQTITFSTAFSSVDYCAQCSIMTNVTAAAGAVLTPWFPTTTYLASSCTIRSRDSTPALATPSTGAYLFTAYGDQ